MTYLQFREQWRKVGCFNIYQIRAWREDFDRTNLSRWVKQGYLLKIRQDWYAFSDMMSESEAAKIIACRIYQPSYISLHAALSDYGIIPEAVSRITCVTTNRTTAYSNTIGEFSYQTVRTEMFFGYKQVAVPNGGFYLLALPEKAIVDLLYLYPQYNTAEALLDLRFDDWWIGHELDRNRLREFALLCKKKSTLQRVELLLKTYCHD